MTNNNFENNNIVNNVIITGQPISMTIISPKGEVLEVNSPDGENYFIINSKTRIGTSISINDVADCKVVKYEYGNLPEPLVEVSVETYEYHGKARGITTDAILAIKKEEGSEERALVASQSAKNKKATLVSSEEIEEHAYSKELVYYSVQATSSKQEERSIVRNYESTEDFFAETISASSLTATRAKCTSFEVEIYHESDLSDFFNFDSIKSTKEVKTASSTKWQSMENTVEINENSLSEYLWYSYDEETRSKHVMNAFEVFIDADEEFSISIEGSFNTWKYYNGNEKFIEFYAGFSDGKYEQSFKIQEETSRKGTVTEVTRSWDGTQAEESITKTITDYRTDVVDTGISSSIRYLNEEDAFSDFMEGVEFYTGHDLITEFISFENEALNFVGDISAEAYKLSDNAEQLALTEGGASRQYLQK